MTFVKVGSGSKKCKQNNFVFTVTSINDSFVLCFLFFCQEMWFFPRPMQKEGERKKGEGGTVPSSLHAVVISWCGGKFYCFPLLSSQSNNLLCCTHSLSPVNFMYNSFFCGHFWSISVMFWMGDPVVCQPSGWSCAIPRGNMRAVGVLNWMAAGQWLG